MAPIPRLAFVGASVVVKIQSACADVPSPTPVALHSTGTTVSQASPAGPLHTSTLFLDSHEAHPNREASFPYGFAPSPSTLSVESLDLSEQEHGRRLDGREPRNGANMMSCQNDAWREGTWGCPYMDECKYWHNGAWHEKNVGELSPFVNNNIDNCAEYYLCGTQSGWADCFETVQVRKRKNTVRCLARASTRLYDSLLTLYFARSCRAPTSHLPRPRLVAHGAEMATQAT